MGRGVRRHFLAAAHARGHPHVLAKPTDACRYMAGRTSRGPITAFFVMQAAAIVLELATRVWEKQAGVKIPVLFRRAITVGFLTWSASFYFFRPYNELGVVMGVVNNAVTILGIKQSL